MFGSLKHNAVVTTGILAIWFIILPLTVLGQQTPVLTQYFNNPLIINPAFAGTRNALAIDIATRQQWMGIKGAPQTYYLVAHTPVNRSKVSLGASLMADKAGPVNNNHLSLAYSYLLRINYRTFVSFGLNTGINNYWIGLNDLEVVDYEDPYFAQNIENAWKPTFGTGLVVFTPAWYLSLSLPQIPLDKIKGPENIELYSATRRIYVSGGYYLFFADGYNVKLSWMGRFAGGATPVHDLNAYFTLKDNFNAGITYRLKSAVALILGAQITPEIGVFYSYDFPVGGTRLQNLSNQEITISFDISRYFIRNRDREFLRKKPAEEDRAIKSIRYF